MKLARRSPSHLLSGTAAIALSNAGARGVGLASALLVAALLGPRSLGAFSLLTVTAALVGAIGLLGFPTLTTRAVARAATPEHAVWVATRALRSCGCSLALVVAGFVLVCHPAVNLVPLRGASSTGVYLTAAWAAALGLSPLLVAVGAGRRAFNVCALLNGSRSLLVAVGTAAGCLLTDTATGTLAGAVVGEWLSVALALAVAHHRGWVSLARLDGRPEGQSGVSLTASGAAGAVALMVQGGVWFGQFTLSRQADGLVDVGVFLLLTRLTLLVTLVPNALATVVLPLLSQPGEEHAHRRTRRVAGMLSTVAAMSSAVVMMVVGPPLLRAIDPAYGGFADVVILMAFVGAATAANNLVGADAVSRGQVRAWIWSDVLLAATLVAGALVLVPMLGALGLALTHLTAYAVSVGFLVMAVRTGGRRP